jgi:GNAT superfamily N-acetyltransferase
MVRPMHAGQNTLKLRVATRADITAVDALLARAYPRLLRADYAPSVMVMALPLISRAKPALVTCGTYFVVEQAGVIVGAGGWTMAHPGGGRTTAGAGNIRHVVTDDRQVRRGVGRALMEHIVATARTAGMQRLDCLSTLTAVPFYQAMGFARQGPVTISLAPGIDFPAIAMVREV